MKKCFRFQLSSFKFLAMLTLCAMLHAPCANAAGMSSIYSLESGSIALTNTQKNSSWVPVALLFRFDAPATGTITVERLTGSTTFLLTSCTISNNQQAVWIPESAVPFNQNDVLNITSTITNATVEIIRKADQ
jgi:hypothetical protein